MKGAKSRMYNILLVEDNPDHIELISSELKRSNRINKIFISYNGEEALNFLFRPAKIEEEVPRPLDFILLDLKMPIMNGFEVLEKVKSHPRFREIPVIILTTSNSFDDMSRAKSLGAEGYIVKTFGNMQLFKNISEIVHT